MESNRSDILFRTRLGAAAGHERQLLGARDELAIHLDATPGASAVETGIWERLEAFLDEHRSAGRIVAGYLGYELLHASERVARLPRGAEAVECVPDVHLIAFGDEEDLEVGAPGRPRPMVGDPALLQSVRTDFTRDEYEQRVSRAREDILAGEFFEVSFTQGLTAPCALDPVTLHERLHDLSPAPAASLLVTPAAAVVSNSPEILLVSRDGRLESWPIKGTRRRDLDPRCDADLADELRGSVKDGAELAMIIDVTRNDLGRVAATGSVRVEDAARLMTLANVHHLEAVVSAEAREGTSIVDAIRAIFPGGSVTGAPKVRAMQEISQLEVSRRGPYCGAMAIFEPDGDAWLSVGIRTGVLAGGLLRLHSGGAVTVDSDPAHEYDEMLAKAAALLAAVSVTRGEGGR